ncbi:MAG: hypothetical protein WKF35_08400 [Ferruginibacter sp.]
MKWSLVSKMNNSDFWVLQFNEDVVAELRFNKDAQSIRLHNGDRRLYFLEQINFHQVRIELKNEYSIVIGECFINKNRSAGTLLLDGEKYTFKSIGLNIVLSDRNEKTISNLLFTQKEDLDILEFSALLFGFCCNHHKSNVKHKFEAA